MLEDGNTTQDRQIKRGDAMGKENAGGMDRFI